MKSHAANDFKPLESWLQPDCQPFEPGQLSLTNRLFWQTIKDLPVARQKVFNAYRPDELANLLITLFHSKTPIERLQLLDTLATHQQAHRKQPTYHEALKIFKQTCIQLATTIVAQQIPITTLTQYPITNTATSTASAPSNPTDIPIQQQDGIPPLTHWREALLQLIYYPLVTLHTQTLAHSMEYATPISLDTNFMCVTANPIAAAALGSTYQQLKGGQHQGLLLDATHAVYLPGQRPWVSSISLAIADGFGGHLDADEDRAIARASRFAVRQSTRVLSLFDSPHALVNQLDPLQSLIKNEVIRQGYGSETTLTAGRIFFSAHACHFVGFGVGDTMAAAWLPSAKRLIPLLPAISSPWGPLGIAAASQYDVTYRASEPLPLDTVFMLFSDGIYDNLPHHKKVTIDAQQRERWEYTLDEAALSPTLSALAPGASAQDYLSAIITIALQQANALRVETLAQQSQTAESATREHHKGKGKQKMPAQLPTDSPALSPRLSLGDDATALVIRWRADFWGHCPDNSTASADTTTLNLSGVSHA